MSREVRMVPKGWEHPKDSDGNFIKEPTTQEGKAKALVALKQQAGEIDRIIDESLPITTKVAKNFSEGLQIAKAISDLQGIMAASPQIKHVIMSLANNPLGFLTDRAPGNYQGKQPYTYEEMLPCVIEGMLKGYRTTGYEMCIIAGRFYAAKNGNYRIVTEWPGLTDFKYNNAPVQHAQQGGIYARVRCWATWKLNGQPMSIGVDDDDKLELQIRVNKGMGEDGIVGKAHAKLFKRVLERISGQIAPESTDIGGEVIDAEIVDRKDLPPDMQDDDLGLGIYSDNKEADTPEKETHQAAENKTPTSKSNPDTSGVEGASKKSAPPPVDPPEVEVGGAEDVKKQESDDLMGRFFDTLKGMYSFVDRPVMNSINEYGETVAVPENNEYSTWPRMVRDLMSIKDGVKVFLGEYNDWLQNNPREGGFDERDWMVFRYFPGGYGMAKAPGVEAFFKRMKEHIDKAPEEVQKALIYKWNLTHKDGPPCPSIKFYHDKDGEGYGGQQEPGEGGSGDPLTKFQAWVDELPRNEIFVTLKEARLSDATLKDMDEARRFRAAYERTYGDQSEMM